MGLKVKLLCFSIDAFQRFLGIRYLSTILYLLPPWTLPILLNRLGAAIGENVKFRQGTRFVNLSSGGFSNLQVGNNCYIGYECMFDLTGTITLEDNVTLAPRCTLLTHQDVGDRPLAKVYPAQKYHTQLKEGCWLGASVTVLGGVEIGKNSAVAAGSLVNKNVQQNTAVGGVPARLIKATLLREQS